MKDNAELISVAQFEAASARLRGCTTPLVFVDDRGSPQVLASGTLFELRDRWFIVTARHNFEAHDGQPPGSLRLCRYPSPYEMDIRAALFEPEQQLDIRYWGSADLDVAVLVLPDSVVDVLRPYWQPATADDLLPSETAYQKAILGGFPSRMAVRPDHAVVPSLLAIATSAYSGPRADVDGTFDPRRHLLLNYPSSGFNLAGAPTQGPQLAGISGCSVWGVRHCGADELWSPSSVLGIVGVQGAVKHGSYIRAVPWVHLVRLFAAIDFNVARHILLAVGCEPRVIASLAEQVDRGELRVQLQPQVGA